MQDDGGRLCVYSSQLMRVCVEMCDVCMYVCGNLDPSLSVRYSEAFIRDRLASAVSEELKVIYLNSKQKLVILLANCCVF